MRARMVSARSRQCRTRSGSASVPATLASRSHATQLMRADEVCTRARVRSSHMPASGVS